MHQYTPIYTPIHTNPIDYKGGAAEGRPPFVVERIGVYIYVYIGVCIGVYIGVYAVVYVL